MHENVGKPTTLAHRGCIIRTTVVLLNKKWCGYFFHILLRKLKLLNCYIFYWIPGKHDAELLYILGFCYKNESQVPGFYDWIFLLKKTCCRGVSTKKMFEMKWAAGLKDLRHWFFENVILWFLYKTECLHVENFSCSENCQVEM